MSERTWEAVDALIVDRLKLSDEALEASLAASADAGLPAIAVSPAYGRLLEILVRMVGARKILEIGTLGGYSAIWMARGLPADGRLITIEHIPRHAEIAGDNIERAGLKGRVDIRVGRALDILPALEAEAAGPFDLVFIDADKANNRTYVEWAIRLGREGTAIVIDNVVKGGAVLDANAADAGVKGRQAALDVLGADPRLIATAIQTVGAKGHDGFALALVR